MFTDFPFVGAKRIWKDGVSSPNQFMLARRRFHVDSALKNLTLCVSADSDFIAKIDGVEIGRGQFSDDPDFPTWGDIAVPELSAGDHLLEFEVYHKGAHFFTYAPGIPGLVYSLLYGEKTLLVSDEKTEVALNPYYKSGERPRTTPQLGFTAEYDARNAVMEWRTPFVLEDDRPMQKRPEAAHPRLGEYMPGRLVASGLIFRRMEANTVALTMSLDQWFRDHRPIEGKLTRIQDNGDGWALLYDLGEEAVGFISFEIDAPAGTIVDFAHGEHLDDGRVRAELFTRNFADRYICREGRQSFELSFRRIGGRYLEFHIIAPHSGAEATLIRAGLVRWILPLPAPTRFETADDKLLKARELAIRTLELCMHEHYEDCPWREQSLYAYDSRNQMLYGYYVWGNWDFAAASLRLFGMSQRPDGHIRICVPTRSKMVIPTFSTIWGLQIYEHLLFSGDTSVWLEERPRLMLMREKMLSQKEPRTGLFQARDKDYWSFYEWAPGVSHCNADENDVHALYNLYLANMLDAMSKAERYCGDSAIADVWQNDAETIRRKVDEIFYDENDGCYATFWHDGKLLPDRHEHTQVLMLQANAVPEEKKARLLDNVMGGVEMVPVTLSVMPYLFQAFLLYDNGQKARQYLRRKLEENYYVMLDGESTTLWETVKGGDDFFYAGSLCHGWSSLPVYYCAAGLLGVVPLEPGFTRFQVRPWSDGRDEASGDIPTRKGVISVHWKKNAEGKLDLEVKYPKGTLPIVSELQDSQLGNIILSEN